MSDYLERIKNLNDKYTGKTVWNCDYLGTWINFDFDYVTFCCSRTNKHTMDNPPICDVGEIKNGHFDKKLFYERLLDAYENNQQGIGPCIGCKHLEKTEFKGIKPNNSIEHVSYNNYRGCNARCVYCFQEKQELIEPYKAYEVVEELYAQNMLAPNMSVDFGGGADYSTGF